MVSWPSGVIVTRASVTESSPVEVSRFEPRRAGCMFHRLDRSTSGVIAFALNAPAASTVSAACFRAVRAVSGAGSCSPRLRAARLRHPQGTGGGAGGTDDLRRLAATSP